MLQYYALKKSDRSGTPILPVTKYLRPVTPSFRSISGLEGDRPAPPVQWKLEQLVTAHSLSLRTTEILCCRPTGNSIRTLMRIWRIRSERTYQILTISSEFEPTASQGLTEWFEPHGPLPWLHIGRFKAYLYVCLYPAAC
ncbi:hypothetical protein MRX96_001724 [Rhipicephalus microplus]